MKIIITIGHPAHVHYFKNAARILEGKGHEILFFIRDRECIVELVKDLGFEYICFGKGGDSMLSKMVQIPIIDYKLLRAALRFKPDMFLSFSSPYAAQVSKLMGKPHIALDDTEHAKLQHMLYRPFTDVILSPYVYCAKLHRRQIKFNSFVEKFYLDKRYFMPSVDILDQLGVIAGEKYCVVRFVSWNANHDVGCNGLTGDDKQNIVRAISKYCKLFISSEGELPIELEPYRLKTSSSKFHDVMHYASLCVSEGSTTASEAAVLGVPAIYVNPLKVSYCDEEERFGILSQLTKTEDVINKAIDILTIDNYLVGHKEKHINLFNNVIDGTKMLVWFVENYPHSKDLLQCDVNYQERFK